MPSEAEIAYIDDTELAQSLGYAQPRMIRKLIKRCMTSGEIQGVVSYPKTQRYQSRPGVWQVRCTTAYRLTEHQARIVAARCAVNKPRLKRRVYFLRCSTNRLIKIGSSQNVEKRFAGLRMQSPVPIKLLGSFPGSTLDERALHKRFANLSDHGEWFRESKELLAYIESMATADSEDPYLSLVEKRANPETPLFEALADQGAETPQAPAPPANVHPIRKAKKS